MFAKNCTIHERKPKDGEDFMGLYDMLREERIEDFYF